MTTASLRADCAQCAALCCVALAFDRSENFAFDKPAGVPCSNLTPRHCCGIYEERVAQGFSGCLSYDCHGAGQRVTQEVFQGRSWRDDPSILMPMLHAFTTMQEIHRLLLLLREAAKAPLSEKDRQRLQGLNQMLHPTGGWTRDSLNQFERDNTADDFRKFLTSLRDYFSGPSSDQPNGLRSSDPILRACARGCQS